ncbi:MAG: GH92 family glycosyl hydrolase [Clostridia bacterium]|nr:GH92 family glycosyl hydrolase [Clostridia bacterium]
MSRIQLVNIKQGTKSVPRFSQGNTLPLVQRPFGMAAFAPQTERNGSWYYHPESHSIEGIRLTHQPSPWINDYGTFLMTPQNDIIANNHGSAWGGHRPKDDVMTPSYVKINFLRSMCDFEVTPTERGAVCRLNFRTDRRSCLSILPLMGDYEYTVVPEKNEIIGSTTGHSGDVAKDFKMYFVLRFPEGAVDFDAVQPEKNGTREGYIHIFLRSQQVEYAIGTSYISPELAELVIEREIGGRSFDEVLCENNGIWEERLSRIDAQFDDADVEKTFYTCLWRTFLFPHKCYEYDADGRMIHYTPIDGTVHEGPRYTDNGFWDTARTVYPLFTLIARDEFAEMLEGFVNDYREGGWLPRWLSIGEVGCMPSTFIDCVIAHAVVNGIGDRKTWEDALDGMMNHANHNGPMPRFGRNGAESYVKLGYVPRDEHGESVNLTLDAAYGDWCIAEIAKILGRDEIVPEYERRAKNYANLWDPETGFMRAKDTAGVMTPDFDPVKWGRDYTEAAAWQTTFAVPHDIEGLAELMGGRDALIAKLDAFFAEPPTYRVWGYGGEIHEMTELAAQDFGQCAISNQPSFHIPFIYAYLGETEKTRYWVHKMALEAFSWRDDGFPGDEDNGTTAAWYVFACLGMYPLCPGKAELVKFPGIAKKWEIRA